MKSFKISIFLLFICSMLHASPVSDLQQVLSKFKTLQANFTQMVMSDDGSLLQKATGDVKIVRPGKFLWQTKAPMQQSIITNGKTVWVYDPDLQQVVVRELSQSLTKTPMLLLTQDHVSLQNTFNIDSKALNDHVTQFTLTPREDDQLFSNVKLDFQGNHIQSMQFENRLGQTTKILFSNVTMNRSVDTTQFEFVPPKNVDIVKN